VIDGRVGSDSMIVGWIQIRSLVVVCRWKGHYWVESDVLLLDCLDENLNSYGCVNGIVDSFVLVLVAVAVEDDIDNAAAAVVAARVVVDLVAPARAAGVGSTSCSW
jgi:hypothetical protein